MAVEEYLALLKKDISAWNHWRELHFDVVPDLARTNFNGMNLSTANLSGVGFVRSTFMVANLHKANCQYVNFAGANLKGANLSGADLRGANLKWANLARVNLQRANLSGANLAGADLTGADLSGADLTGANLMDAKWTAAIMPDGLLAEAHQAKPLGDEENQISSASRSSLPQQEASEVLTSLKTGRVVRHPIISSEEGMEQLTQKNGHHHSNLMNV